MSLKKFLDFIQEIGTIMYVGGILSHIAIGVIIGHPDAVTANIVYVYKEMSAYVLILPGLALKLLSDIAMYLSAQEKPNWLKLKLAMMAFLTINAFIFLVPMMPEIVQLTEVGIVAGELPQEFLDKISTEQMVGMSNVIPLIAELILGSFRPKLGKERNT